MVNCSVGHANHALFKVTGPQFGQVGNFISGCQLSRRYYVAKILNSVDYILTELFKTEQKDILRHNNFVMT